MPTPTPPRPLVHALEQASASSADGEINGHTVGCPGPGSRFDLGAGGLLQGPATASRPAFDGRETGGHVDVWRRTRG